MVTEDSRPWRALSSSAGEDRLQYSHVTAHVDEEAGRQYWDISRMKNKILVYESDSFVFDAAKYVPILTL